MHSRFFTALLLLVLCCNKGIAQCSALGQTPQTAFPVCGTSVFTQTTVPICTNHNINVPGCAGGGATYADTNPFWYRITCYQAGTLGFTITPADPTDDYDWQLYDITGRNAADVYTDNSLFVCANWAGTYAPTGASNAGTANVECASLPSDNVNTFTKMPFLTQGHTYLLLVSHYTQTQSGYGLSFGNGGTAIITDTTKPALQSALANCAGTKIGVKLTKKMRCASLAPDGSDFTLSPAAATITGISSNSCTTGFDMDSLEINLSNALPAGNYTVTIKNGADANTLLDNCDNGIPVGDKVVFGFTPGIPVKMDSISPVGCAPRTLQLVFKKRITCNSIAPDGSDFSVTGPYPVTISAAKGSCDANGLSNTITVYLAAPITHAGVYTLHLKSGTDGGTIVDECGEVVAAGEAVAFTCADTVSAAFALHINHGCVQDTVLFAHQGGNGINNWQWLFNDAYTSTLQLFSRIYKDSGQMSAKLIVSNGVCTDTSLQLFALGGKIKAVFTAPSTICPLDTALFKDASTGYITRWNWYFGNNQTSTQQNPPYQVYPAGNSETVYPVRLIVQNTVPCFDTTYRFVKVVYSCYIAVPSAFTPNGDGHNDYLYPLNAYKAVNLTFRVFNRWGQQVFETKDWTQKWDGSTNGVPQGSGVYVWMLSYTDSVTGRPYQQKGTTVLVR